MKMHEIEKGGKTFILVPKPVFEELLADAEMLEDIASYDLAKRKVREYFPSEYVDRLLEGENKIKLWREYRKLTQEQLAKRANIGRGNLAMIETGKKQGSLAT
jgi:DNA-binding transcriptional regulator YiaG